MHGLRTLLITRNQSGFCLKAEPAGFLLQMFPPTHKRRAGCAVQQGAMMLELRKPGAGSPQQHYTS